MTALQECLQSLLVEMEHTISQSTLVLMMEKFEIRVNGALICSAEGDLNESGTGDNAQATCSGIVNLTEGKCFKN